AAVASRHRHPGLVHHARDSAHPRTADADEVHPSEVIRQLQCQIGVDHRFSFNAEGRLYASRTRSYSRSVPSSTPALRARRDISFKRDLSCRSGIKVDRTQALVSALSSTSNAPPAPTTPAALKRCSPFPT